MERQHFPDLLRRLAIDCFSPAASLPRRLLRSSRGRPFRTKFLHDYVMENGPPWSGCLLNADNELLLEP